MRGDGVPTPRPFTLPTVMVPARIAAPLAFAVTLRVIPDAAHTTLGKHVTATNVAQRKSVCIAHPLRSLSSGREELRDRQSKGHNGRISTDKGAGAVLNVYRNAQITRNRRAAGCIVENDCSRYRHRSNGSGGRAFLQR